MRRRAYQSRRARQCVRRRGPIRWGTTVASLLLALATATPRAATKAEPPQPTVFRLHVAVAEEAGRPVVDEEWIRSQVTTANRIFEPSGISFRVALNGRLPDRHARLDTRRDRHALGRFLEPGYINWWAVASLRDVDDPSQFRRGVHWRPRGDYPDGSHFVIVSAIAAPTVLAHELGHFFGNRRHSDTPGNIMSYERLDRLPWFDRGQLRIIARHRQQFVRSGELEPCSSQDHLPACPE